MYSLLTIVAQLVVLAAGVYVYVRSLQTHDRVDEAETRVNVTAFKLRDERARVTVLERELDALRRELRKLGGKFYASQRAIEDVSDDEPLHAPGFGRPFKPVDVVHPPCDNWITAQREGPSSTASKCECLYCLTQRANRERIKAALVPKGARDVAKTARLNAGHDDGE